MPVQLVAVHNFSKTLVTEVDCQKYTQVIPKLGETVTGSSFLLGYGGKGANQCVASKLLGCNTALVGKVGEDYFGDIFLEHLKQLGVNTDGVTKSPKCSTGVASITVDTGTGENQIIIVPGANMLITDSDINRANQQYMIFNTKVIVCQFEINPVATLHSLRYGRTNGVKTILNPAPAPVPSENNELGNYELLDMILSNSDFVCLNECEFCSITGSDLESLPPENEQITSSNVHTFIPGLIYLIEKKVRWPIVTLGSKGAIAVLYAEDMVGMQNNDVSVVAHVSLGNEEKLIVHLASPKIDDVTDTTVSQVVFFKYKVDKT
uniref:Carbohydrate kinase PfkB domain-containing protein n=1 Tax=Trichobilharzia regenti TaxID=157069 RepID=A0AA85K906_TRIRE|nr:unnamed protein product [Trichobilharzia regenti]